jgi:NADPH:quinone reductase-like Zn-dependent oxidoreductase
LIQVAATSYNPVDAAIRSGLFQSVFQIAFPHTLGLDVAGVVTQTGVSVRDFNVGDQVYAYLDMVSNGAAAEYVACKASLVAEAPTSIPLSDVAGLPLAASTAWQALFEHGQLKSGQRILITAAAGGVGTIAVQLAKWKGAYVLGTASSRSFGLLEELGVDEIIDYKKEEHLKVINEPVDLIINLSPVDTPEVNKLLRLLKPGGILVSAARPADISEAERLGVSTVRMASKRNAGQLKEIAQLVDAGLLRPVITARLPVSEIAVCHQQTGQTNGKTILIVNEKYKPAAN